ncbi:unnamed protein product, partial [Brachionus calyciflorus]
MGVKNSKEELLKLTRKRIVNDVRKPITSILQIEDLFDDSDKIDSSNLIRLKNHLENEGRLSPHLVVKLIENCVKIFKKESNVLKIDYPVNIVGDIHGQFYDLLTIFSLGGSPEDCKYLFMGDFVDRGVFAF